MGYGGKALVDIVALGGLAFSAVLVVVGAVLVRHGRKATGNPPPPPPAMQLTVTLPFAADHSESQEEEENKPSILRIGKEIEEFFDKKD